MDLGLSGKVALVSGASKGIGRAIALQLAAEGAKVVLTARGKADLDDAVNEVRDRGGEAIAVTADMTVWTDVRRVVAEAEAAYGEVDIAISNVHPLHRYSFEEATAEDFQKAFDLMVMSVVHLTRAVTPGMKRKGWGRLVNVGSVSMKEVKREPSLILSNTFRLAVVGLNKSLADELGPHGITVNTTATGWFRTEKLKASHEKVNGPSTWEQIEENRVNHVPLRRIGHTAEIAGTCAFLCSEQAGYMTGQVIAVDGGRIASY